MLPIKEGDIVSMVPCEGFPTEHDWDLVKITSIWDGVVGDRVVFVENMIGQTITCRDGGFESV